MEGAKLLKQFKDYLFPVFCVECRCEGEWWCGDCLSKQDIAPFEIGVDCGLNSATTLFCYSESDPIAKLIKMFKYDFNLEISDLWKKIISESKISFPKNLLVIPVPLFPKRKRERGFNQAEILAKILAEANDLEIDFASLNRIRATPQQTKLSREKRLTNLKGAFGWKGEPLGGRKILLVDDVLTTGATMRECAEVLRAAGASEIRGFVLAHG